MNTTPGQLTLVPTPVGNLEDITLRAINILRTTDVLLAEDTRNTQFLCKHLGIDRKILAHHAHNEHQAVPEIIKFLLQGQSVALVTDAGTPGISDPGFLLVKNCIAAHITVQCLPGATAFVPALVCSGLPTEKFVFEGFLPVKKGRQTRLKFLANEDRTMVFYESPHRIVKTLTEFAEYFGAERQVCVSKEISKIFESHFRGTITEVLTMLNEKNTKGEFVVCVAGK